MQIIQELRRRQKAVLKEFKNREKRGKQLLRKIAAHEKALEALKDELSDLFDQSGAVSTAAVSSELQREPDKTQHLTTQRKGPTKFEYVKMILEKSDHAMSVAEITEALQGAGYAFRSKHPDAALKVMLYSHKQLFTIVSPGRFAVVGAAKSLASNIDNTNQDEPAQ